MAGSLVTVGVPVYRGQDTLPATLECMRTQTYTNLDILISVDGPDDAVVEACKPFLGDSRFRLHIQPSRLGWAGNTDWTMRHRRGDFYIYQQHDDQVSRSYIADLVEAAMRWPHATICYSEMEFSGRQNMMIRHKPNLDPDPIKRALAHMERLDSGPLRGLIRGSALSATSGLQTNEFESFGSEHAFMAELALAGEFRFVKGPIYYKRLHPQNMHLRWYGWPEARKRAAWSALAAWMIEVIVPCGRSLDDRWRLFNIVLDRFLVARGWLARFDQWAIDRLNGWTVDRKRLMFCRVDNNDLEARAAMLRTIMGRLRSGGRLDVSACLQSTWDSVEEVTLRSFGVDGTSPEVMVDRAQ
jgi:hypothetical protein